MLDDLFLRTLAAGCGVAALSGLLGPFVIWRRMAYVGDAMGHAALLGVVAGMMVGLAPLPSVLLLAVLAGLLLSRLGKDSRLPFDALLVVLSTGALAGGLILFSTYPNRQTDIMGYLFGDILAVTQNDMWWIAASLAVVVLVLARNWKNLLRFVLHEDVARVEGVNVAKLSLLLTIMVALTVAVAVQVVGMLLITALLVVPALTARSFARTPGEMVLGSVIVALASAIGGIHLAYHYNQQPGPCIVLVAILLLTCARVTAPKARN